ncbi:hypothetical protein Trydic_g5430 [Trypoxylus dichotomus]
MLCQVVAEMFGNQPTQDNSVGMKIFVSCCRDVWDNLANNPADPKRHHRTELEKSYLSKYTAIPSYLESAVAVNQRPKNPYSAQRNSMFTFEDATRLEFDEPADLHATQFIEENEDNYEDMACVTKKGGSANTGL